MVQPYTSHYLCPMIWSNIGTPNDSTVSSHVVSTARLVEYQQFSSRYSSAKLVAQSHQCILDLVKSSAVVVGRSYTFHPCSIPPKSVADANPNTNLA